MKRISQKPSWFRLNDWSNHLKIIVKQSIFIEKVQPDRFLFLLLERGEIDLENVIDKLKKDNNFTVAKMRFYWEQMLEAVQECHASGVIHADIKPQNFVLVKGQLKLIDFGFALQIEPGKNSVERIHVAGTKQFLSPEIAGMKLRKTGMIDKGKVE